MGEFLKFLKGIFIVADSQLISVDLAEEWREYDFTGRVYRITSPVKLFYREGASNQHVVDKDTVVHYVPSPGSNGCVVRYSPLDKTKPVV